jgi:hypothetical protein
MKVRPSGKRRTVTAQLLPQRPQRRLSAGLAKAARSPGEMRAVFIPVRQLLRAMRAAPKAPMRPAMSGRSTSRPRRFSRALRTASLLKVPPWTTIDGPSSAGSRRRITLKRALRMTE